jgi:hypothetical protein
MRVSRRRLLAITAMLATTKRTAAGGAVHLIDGDACPGAIRVQTGDFVTGALPDSLAAGKYIAALCPAHAFLLGEILRTRRVPVQGTPNHLLFELPATLSRPA